MVSLPNLQINTCFQLGVGNYSIIYNNCEHFATSCRYGKKCSTQVVLLHYHTLIDQKYVKVDNLMSVVATAMLGVIPVGLLFRAYEFGHCWEQPNAIIKKAFCII